MRQRRRLALLAAASVAVLAAAGCGSTSAAVTVEGQSISRSDFEDSLDVVSGNEALLGYLFQGATRDQVVEEGAPPGVFSQAYVGAMAGVQIEFLVAPVIAEDEGLEITDATRDEVRSQLESGAGDALDDLPASVRDSYVEGLAAIQVLQAEVDPEDLQTLVVDGFQDADVQVSSRYGSWDPDEGGIVPPTGPRSAPGADSATTLDGSELPAG